MKKHSGFTLIELLIVTVISIAVLGSISLGIRASLSLFARAEANSLVITGARFSADGLSRSLYPLLDAATEIEILNINNENEIPAPAAMSKDEHYFFLKGDSVLHRTVSGDYPLEGSQYIDRLKFNLPISGSDLPENYLLNIEISAVYPQNRTAKLDLALKKALYNKPLKSGASESTSLYGGNVLLVKAAPYARILNASTGESAAEQTFSTDTKLMADYLTFEPNASLRWCVAVSSASKTEITDSKAAGGYMVITDAAGTIIESDVISSAPSGDIYVKTASGTAKYGEKEYYIRYNAGSLWSPWIKSVSSAGRRYYKEDLAKYFTGSGEFVTSKNQTDYLKQILADVQSVFDRAVSDKKAMLDKLSKANLINNRKYSANASYGKDFASYIVGLLDIYYLSDFAGVTDFYIGFAKQSDGSYVLTSILFKAGADSYVIYPNGHIYKTTNNLYAGNSTAITNGESFFTETWKDFQGIPGREDYTFDGKEAVGWLRMDTLFTERDKNYTYDNYETFVKKKKYFYGEIVEENNILYRCVDPENSDGPSIRPWRSSVWQAIGTADGTLPLYDRQTTYALGTVVSKNGGVYMYAPLDNNIRDLSSSAWIDVSQNPNIEKPAIVQGVYPDAVKDDGGWSVRVNGCHYYYDNTLYLYYGDDFIWGKISYNSIRDNIFVAVTNSSYRYENVRYEAGRVVWYKGYHYSAKKDFITYNAAANAVYTRPSNTPSSYWQRYIMK